MFNDDINNVDDFEEMSTQLVDALNDDDVEMRERRSLPSNVQPQGLNSNDSHF